MRRRLYFLLPDTDTAKNIVDELLLARISDNHIHLLAKDDSRLKGLPVAGILQKTDLMHGLELGLIIGGFTGMVAGALLSLLPDHFMAAAAFTVICTIAGSVIGAWAAGMIGANLQNSRLRMFQADIKQGKILLMVDVPRDDVERIHDMIHSHHPEAGDKGTDPTIPAFP